MRSVVLVMLALALVACEDDDEQATATQPPTAATQETTSTSSAPVASTVMSTALTSTVGETVTTSSPSSTSDASGVTTTVPGGAVVPVGFDQVAGTVTAADGTVCELCLWLAATGEQRGLGLMYATDLGGPDGMLFRYDTPTTASFWMKNTVMPLSIAFFDGEGAYLDSFDMQPCSADPCPAYPTPSDFVYAIEVSQGALTEFAIAPGSVLSLSNLPCE
jgi:hypothetical protein